MKIITRGEAMRIHRQHPASCLFPFCTRQIPLARAVLKRIPVVKCKGYSRCAGRVLLNATYGTVLARMSG